MIERTVETMNLHIDVTVWRMPERTRVPLGSLVGSLSCISDGEAEYRSLYRDLMRKLEEAPEGSPRVRKVAMLRESLSDLRYIYDHETFVDVDEAREAWEEVADAAYELGLYDIDVRMWKESW